RGGWRGEREIHEAASVDGPVHDLRGDLIHYPYRSLEQQLAKTQRYARMMAEHEFARGKRATWTRLVLAPAWRFWRGYVLRADLAAAGAASARSTRPPASTAPCTTCVATSSTTPTVRWSSSWPRPSAMRG